MRPITPQEDLLRALFRELFQAEMSGSSHPEKEARRPAPSPPADAMATVARDCAKTLPELATLAEERGFPVSAMGLGVGRPLSALRRMTIDLFVTKEMSYRVTLLGMRHGVDVLRLLRHAAAADDDAAVVEFCDRILDRREPMILDLEMELRWFADHPDLAMRPAERGLLARYACAFRRLLGRLDDAIAGALSVLPIGGAQRMERASRPVLPGWHVGRLIV